MGLLVFISLEDSLLLCRSKTSAQIKNNLLVHDSSASGMEINVEKGALQPMQQLEFLGLKLDLRHELLSFRFSALR